MKIVFAILVTVLFVITGSIAAYQVKELDLLLLLLIISTIQIFMFRQDWGALQKVVTSGVVLSSGLGVILLILSKAFENSSIIFLTQSVCAGLVSITAFMPRVFDSTFSLLPSQKSSDPGIAVAIILYRNNLVTRVREFWMGFHASPQSSNFNLKVRFQMALLISIILAARVPSTSTDFLTTAYVRRFKAVDTVVLGPPSTNFFIGTVLGLIAFIIILFKVRI